MHSLRIIAVSLAVTLATIPSTLPWARAQNPGILGVWWTENNKGRVEIVDCAPPKQGVCGTIIWISQPNDSQGTTGDGGHGERAGLRGFQQAVGGKA